MPVETVNSLLAIGTIGMQIAAVAFLALYFLEDNIPDLKDIGALLGRWGFHIGFVIALAASAITLIHQYLYSLPPCVLCIWQRFFMYPLVLVLALAVWKRDIRLANFSILLSIIGLGIGVYHHVMQMYPSAGLPCPSTGAVSCEKIFFLEFGYITYPMMAISAFAFLIVLMLFVRKGSSE